MLKGTIKCKCGQTFGFQTTLKFVNCPKCEASYAAKDYGTEIPVEEVVEDGVDD